MFLAFLLCLSVSLSLYICVCVCYQPDSSTNYCKMSKFCILIAVPIRYSCIPLPYRDTTAAFFMNISLSVCNKGHKKIEYFTVYSRFSCYNRFNMLRLLLTHTNLHIFFSNNRWNVARSYSFDGNFPRSLPLGNTSVYTLTLTFVPT